MGKRFGSVSDLVSANADKPVSDRFTEESEKRSIGRALFVMRNAMGLTQQQVAQELSTTQSAVSRFEHIEDGAIKLEELAMYVGAIGHKVTVTIHAERSAVE